MAAQEIQIAPQDGATAKLRGPVAVAVLSFITLFIYFFVWYYKINRELRDYGRAQGAELGDSPVTSLVAVTLGALIIVPPLVSMYHTAKRIQRAQELAGVQPLNGWLALVLYLLFSPLLFAYEQSELNKVWRVVGGVDPSAAPSPLPAT